MLKNTKDSYGLTTKLFHWVSGFFIIGLMFVGFTMSDMPDSDAKFALYNQHKASGVIVLMLVILRILWKFSNEAVNHPSSVSTILVILAKIGHFILYVFMLSMPISGILMTHFSGYDISVFGLFTIDAASEKIPDIAKLFHQVHVFGVLAFIAVIILHIGASLYHHFILKNNILIRMIK